MTRDNDPRELTLDPDNWDDMRKLGHRMLYDMMNHLEQVRDRPIMQKVDDEAREAFTQPPPMQGVGAEAAYEEFVEQLLRNQSYFNKHHRFWGFVVGTGSPSSMLARCARRFTPLH